MMHGGMTVLGAPSACSGRSCIIRAVIVASLGQVASADRAWHGFRRLDLMNLARGNALDPLVLRLAVAQFRVAVGLGGSGWLRLRRSQPGRPLALAASRCCGFGVNAPSQAPNPRFAITLGLMSRRIALLRLHA